MSAPAADRTAAEMDLVAVRAEIERLQQKVTDLEDALKGARHTVGEQQRDQQAHALVCRVVHRPSSRGTRDVPTGGLT